MKKYQLLGIATLTLLGLCGVMWASQAASTSVAADAEIAAVLTLTAEEFAASEMSKEVTLEDLFGPINPALGDCKSDHKSSQSSCESWCYLSPPQCGYDYWNPSNCMCYCGYQL